MLVRNTVMWSNLERADSEKTRGFVGRIMSDLPRSSRRNRFRNRHAGKKNLVLGEVGRLFRKELWMLSHRASHVSISEPTFVSNNTLKWGL